MTPSARQGLGFAVALLLATLVQCVYADALRIFGATPDFLLTTALVGSLFCDANGGAALGFFAGLFHASLASPPNGGFGSLIVSRTLTCLLVGWLEERIFRDSVALAVVLAACGTLLAEGLFYVFAPQPNVLHWARSVGLTTLYNSLLALPLHYLLRRLLGLAKSYRDL